MKRKSNLLITLLLFVSLMVDAQGFDDDKPSVTYDNSYSQEFNPTAGWDYEEFYRQWGTKNQGVFNANDITTGALKFEWANKRIIFSNRKYEQPYAFEADFEYASASNRGGVVIRIPYICADIQQPQADPGFNNIGLAFYPSVAGDSMIVQFSDDLNGTSNTCIKVSKPAGVSSLMDRGTLRVEDFDTAIYVYYNDNPYIRINLNGKVNDSYTSGTVYDSTMTVVGNFSGMDVPDLGHVSVAQRDASLLLYNTSIDYSETVIANPIDTNVYESPYRDLYTDTWVATDALGREMPLYDDIGEKSEKRRKVGIFYISWHSEAAYRDLSSPYSNDVTDILAGNPDARFDAQHPAWNYPENSYHWGEPEMGYYLSNDEAVIRKDMAMLSNAGVDVLFLDATNGFKYWNEWDLLFKVMELMKKEGNDVPKICFWAFNGEVITVVQEIYQRYYKAGLHQDLWFYWDGKPLLLYRENPDTVNTTHPNPNYEPDAVTNPENPHYGDPYYTQVNYTDYTQEVKDFFTTRNMWWGYYEFEGERYIGTEDNWSFGYQLNDPDVANMDPDDLVATHDGIKEAATVTPAQHPTAMVGKSWSRANGEPSLNNYDMPDSAYVPYLDSTVTNPENYGIYFQERWDEAINTDPDFIYLNDWNEWTATKWHNGIISTFMDRDNSPYYFVDQYNAEFNRVIMPMQDGYTDNYYMQMVQNIRKYKGVRQLYLKVGETNITVDNNYTDWSLVTDEFRDAIGDTRHRDHNGYGGLHYTNNTGRNDIMTSKVAYDSSKVYFYVKTVDNLTPHSDPNWMLLFIDADRDIQTGWEGYDYVINNGVSSSTQTTLKQWTGSGWSNPVTLNFTYSDTEMEIAVPKSDLGISGSFPEFYFKWADNPQHLNDVSAFFNDGEAAPDRRFKYNFQKPPAFDQRTGVNFQIEYQQDFTLGSIDQTKFDNQWNQASFSNIDLTSGYLKFNWSPDRIIYSNGDYDAPYSVEGRLGYGSSSNRGGLVVRAGDFSELLQETPSDPGFNSDGIAIYPADNDSLVIQFTAADNINQTQIKVVKPDGVPDLMTTPFDLRVEDYDSTLYVFVDDKPLARIDLSDLSGGVYSSGVVFDATMDIAGKFFSMEVLQTGNVSFCQRDAALQLYDAEIKVENTLIWDERPDVNFMVDYQQSFISGSIDQTKFDNQWYQEAFSNIDLSTGYLKFNWIADRIIYSNGGYDAPYSVEGRLGYGSSSNRGGVVVRAGGFSELLQQPPFDPGFNSDGIAIYPADNDSLVIQFTAADNINQTQIKVVKPDGVPDLMTTPFDLRIEDYDSSIYVFVNNLPFARIDVSDLSGGVYSSGVVFDASMDIAGSFSGMEVLQIGNVSFCQRDAALQLYDAEIKVENTLIWDERPDVNFMVDYQQDFTSGSIDQTIFDNQWYQAAFSNIDLSSGYLKFNWIADRIIYSNGGYDAPYSVEGLLGYGSSSNRGGVVVRAGDFSELLQQPPFDPGFNSDGIAIYPADNDSLVIQFTAANNSSQTQIKVVKPDGVPDLMTTPFDLRIEDYDSSIYVFVNNLPFARIDVSDLSGGVYSSGVVFDASMDIAGSFSGMEVLQIGNVSFCQRDAALQLYDAEINIISELKSQDMTIPTKEEIDSQGLQLISFPNPFSEYTIVEFSLENASLVNFELFNQSGSRMVSIDKAFASGKGEMIISADNLDAGMYLLKVSANNKTEFIKVVIE